MNCLSRGVLRGEHPFAYLLFALVHFAGAAVYTVQWYLDRKNDFSQAVCCGASASALATIHIAVCCLAVINPAYRYSFFYLRAGIIACAMLCSIFGLIRAFQTKEKTKRLAAIIAVGIGLDLALSVWILEFIF